MNRKSFSILLSAAFILTAVSSCRELEPSTWTETLHRVATVRQSGESVRLEIDYSGENFILGNFKNASHMAAFGVRDGDRILAHMTYNAVGNANNATFTLDSIHKIAVSDLEISCPPDTQNFYYEMDVLELVSLSYPAIWNAGHIVNLAPVFFVPEGERKADFSLYPLCVRGDTLVVRMYADIPDDDVSLFPQYRQKIMNFDISSLADSVADPVEHARRQAMLASLRTYGESRIYVQVVSPDTLRAKSSKNQSSGYKFELTTQLIPQTVRIPFDF
ncbi:MAG: hypothetical protein MJY66_08220 [Bacteroidaceae bacterium]|nr:hypothetical protein [Bacteroidaceae bacterium]